MQPKDTVISFNYDRVLNILNEYLVTTKKPRPRGRFVLNSPVGRDSEQVDATRDVAVPMYHLHGHVGWLSPDGKGVDCGSANSAGIRPALARAHYTPEGAVLGLPGRIKTAMPTGILKDVWDRAMGAIRNADSIVFVGYRFPETDNVAKQELADALRNNPKARVHVVLGAGSADLPCLVGMIGWTRDDNANPVHVHQMKCQDFFAVFERNKL